ncbi:MAG: hypothetical protein AAGA32_06725 [Pseudomonadota bacterium]
MARHESVADYHAEAERRRAELRAPRDGAVFHTSVAWREAGAYAEARTAEGQPTQVVEHTPYGRELHAEQLYGDAAFNARAHREGYGPNTGTAGADAVWKDTSRIYAEEAEGRVTVFVGRRNGGRIDPDSTFGSVERDTLLANEKVTEINGLEREKLATLDSAEVDHLIEETSRARRLDKEARMERERELREELDRKVEQTADRSQTATADEARAAEAERTAERERAAAAERGHAARKEADTWGDIERGHEAKRQAEQDNWGDDDRKRDPDPWGDGKAADARKSQDKTR